MKSFPSRIALAELGAADVGPLDLYEHFFAVVASLGQAVTVYRKKPAALAAGSVLAEAYLLTTNGMVTWPNDCPLVASTRFIVNVTPDSRLPTPWK